MAKLDDIEGRLSKKVVDSKEISLTMPTDLPHGIPQIQPSSASPTIPKPSTQSPVESKDGLPTVEEFDELVSAKARLLRDGYERGKAIENLCVLNLDHARMLLYQDYMRFLTTDYEMTSEDWTHIRFHLEQYVQAENLWDNIRKGFGRKFSAESDSNVVEVAASQVVIADCEARMSEELRQSGRQREIYDQAKKFLSSRYKLQVVANENKEDSYAYSRNEYWLKITRFVSRMKMAVFGGYALVIPMLIMTLHPTPLTNLLTTTLFVLAVAVVLAAWMTDAEGKDIIAATAAYAAVLVVFVGTTTTETVQNRAVVVGIMVSVMIGVPFLILCPFLLIRSAHWIYQYYDRKDEEERALGLTEE